MESNAGLVNPTKVLLISATAEFLFALAKGSGKFSSLCASLLVHFDLWLPWETTYLSIHNTPNFDNDTSYKS